MKQEKPKLLTRVLGYLWLGIWAIVTIMVFIIMGYAVIHAPETMELISGEPTNWLKIGIGLGLGLLLFGLISTLGYLTLVLILPLVGINLETPFD